MTGGIGRATTVLNDYFRNHFGWKVYSIYAFEAKEDCVRAVNDGAIQLRLHDRLGLRRLADNYKRAAAFIRQNQIQIVIIQTSMDVVAKLRKALDRDNLHDVKIISVLHYSPGTDEFPISVSVLKQDILKSKGFVKNILKGIIAPAYNWFEHYATVKAYQKAYSFGNAVIVLSDSYIPAYQDFAHLNENRKLFSIPNCLPFEYFITDAEIYAKSNSVLVVGRMVDFPKRISMILKMWKKIEQHPNIKDWNLDIVGDGPDLEMFKTLANELGLSRCSFHGRQDPINYYRRASLFFMASEFEGFPMTLVEAQMMGCVPIVFDTFSSLREVITDKVNGRIIPKDDSVSFVSSTIALMNNPAERYRLLKKGLEDCQQFSKKNVCDRWNNLFKSLSLSIWD